MKPLPTERQPLSASFLKRLRARVAAVSPGSRVILYSESDTPEDKLPQTWSGKHMYLDQNGYYAEDALHELAHLLIAPLRLRRRSNFGLGTDPWNYRSCKAHVSPRVAESYEARAMLVHIALVYAWGLCATHVHSLYNAPALDRVPTRLVKNVLTPQEWRAFRTRYAALKHRFDYASG